MFSCRLSVFEQDFRNNYLAQKSFLAFAEYVKSTHGKQSFTFQLTSLQRN